MASCLATEGLLMEELLNAKVASPRPRCPRRWLQFGFATLLKLVAVAAMLSAWWADRERLTQRIGRLENDQSVLRIAIGDDVEDGSWYSDPYAPYGVAPAGAPGGPWTYPATA